MTRSVAWSAEELFQRLNRGDDPFILDVRATDEYDAWRLEGRATLSGLNVPFFEMLEEDVHEDVVDSLADFLGAGLTAKLPDRGPILAVCAEGDASDYVATALRRLGYAALNLTGGMAAWGDHHRVTQVASRKELEILQIARPARGCLSHVVASHGEAVIVDPLRHIDLYLDLLGERGWTVRHVLDTHGHADHISGGPALAEELGSPYRLHPYDGIHPIDVLPARLPFEYVRDGLRLRFGGALMKVLHVPGHTLGNTALLLDERFLFAGDSIFLDSVARPDLGGHAEAWAPLHHASLQRLLELPEDTVVFPGHFANLAEADVEGCFRGRLGDLRRDNEGLRRAAGPQEAFVAYLLSSLPRFPEQYVEIKRVNAGLLAPNEARKSELELGKNVCALKQAYEAA